MRLSSGKRSTASPELVRIYIILVEDAALARFLLVMAGLGVFLLTVAREFIE